MANNRHAEGANMQRKNACGTLAGASDDHPSRTHSAILNHGFRALLEVGLRRSLVQLLLTRLDSSVPR
jgi:hypothetical protein